MFDSLVRLAFQRPKTVLLVTAILLTGALLYGLDVISGLKAGGQVDPNSESAKGAAALEAQFGASRPNIVLLARANTSVDDPAVAADADRLATRLAAEPKVAGVVSYWQTKAPSLRSHDGRMALIAARLTGDEDKVSEEFNDIADQYRGTQGSLTVHIGGSAAVRSELTHTVREDIAKAEAIGIPLTALVLIFILRGFFAALLPLVVGAVSVIGTNAALKAISQFTDVSVFTLNLATGLSLGLAADYGLFIVKRYREERHNGHSVPTALRITMNTAGRTVAYSSLTVAVAMSAMLVFPMYFLRSFAYAGILVVLLASISAMVVLPATLVVMGRLLDVWDVTRAFTWLAGKFRRGNKVSTSDSWWRRSALLIMRRPWVFAISATAILLIMGLPVLRMNIGLPDDRTLPAHAESHRVQQTLREDFDSAATGAVYVLAPGVNPGPETKNLTSYAAKLSQVSGVVAVDSAVGRFVNGKQVAPADPPSQRFVSPQSTYLAVNTKIESISSTGQNLVKQIRAVPTPFPTLVAGGSADLLDTRDALIDRLLWALGIIVLTTLVLIFFLTGSVLIPIKAVVMNVLSLSATFGVLIWIFQEYHLGGLLGFQETGWVDISLLVLLFCVAFGVSMDYEVFLLSRIKEEYARTGDNRTAVAYGIEKTGGIVTAAALINYIVFIAMASAQVTNIKMFGVGLALAMLLDATLIRTVLVPALMRLAGEANWWAPRPLRTFYDRFGLKESSEMPDVQPAKVSS